MTHSGSLFAGYTPPGIDPGAVLANRYRVVNVLGQGGFGRTYLASDSNRFNEYCVLKEFAPQVQQPDYVQKARDLFEREAGVLYRLEHSQIPRFRELLQTQHNDREYLLLVQDYVKGQTYRDLLSTRQRQGVTFSEAEVTYLLRQLLPVLAYIHANGVIHRDISPDNLMRREADGLPILIDFGGVKQAAASVLSQFSQVVPQTTESTRLGKVGYAPPEQLQQGLVYPHSDLYALGVTVLVLLTGQEPQTLINPNTLEWQWRSWVTVSPTLAAVFDRLLVYRPSDRFPSATSVLLALNGAAPPASSVPSTPTPPPSYHAAPSYPATSATIAVGGSQPLPPSTMPTGYPPASYPPAAIPQTATPPAPKPQSWDPAAVFAFTMFTAILVGGGVFLLRNAFTGQPQPTPQTSTPVTSGTPIASAPAQAWERDQTLLQQAQQEGIDPKFFRDLVDDRFSATYGNQPLTTADIDAASRENWSRLGQDWLGKLKALPKEWRSTLGNFSASDYDRWVKALQQKNVTRNAFIDLVDNPFFQWFPDVSEGELKGNSPLLKVWFTMADTTAKDVLNGKALGEIQIDPNSFNGRVSESVASRQGRVYLATLKQGDKVRATLTPEDPAVRWSIYSPSGQTLQRKSKAAATWSSTLTESGSYEFVILGGDNASNFTLDLIAESPTPSPTPSLLPTPEATLSPEVTPSATPDTTQTPDSGPAGTPRKGKKNKNQPDAPPPDNTQNP